MTCWINVHCAEKPLYTRFQSTHKNTTFHRLPSISLIAKPLHIPHTKVDILQILLCLIRFLILNKKSHDSLSKLVTVLVS